MLFDPNDLSTKQQPAGSEVGSDDIAVQSPMPDIRHIPGEQRIRISPVGAIVVEHLASGELAGTVVAARSPGRIITDPIRRIGDHQVRLGCAQHRSDIGCSGAIAATDPVVSQLPYIAEFSDRLIECFRHAVGIR